MKEYIENIVVAKPNYCVPAVLEMVLKHYGIESLKQDDIARQFRIVSAEDEVAPENWGAQIEKYTINDFFSNNGFPLHEEYVSINIFMDEYDLADKIASLLEREVTIICGYNYSRLYKSGTDRYRHVSIIVSITDDKKKVGLLDPGPKNAGINIVQVEDLFDAIKAGHDGLWCIKSYTCKTSTLNNY